MSCCKILWKMMNKNALFVAVTIIIWSWDSWFLWAVIFGDFLVIRGRTWLWWHGIFCFVFLWVCVFRISCHFLPWGPVSVRELRVVFFSMLVRVSKFYCQILNMFDIVGMAPMSLQSPHQCWVRSQTRFHLTPQHVPVSVIRILSCY